MKTVNNPTTNSNTNFTRNDLISAENKSFKRRGALQQKVRKLRQLKSLTLLTQVSWKQRFVSLLLMFCIFSTTVFASPESARTVVVSADEYKKSVQFAMATSNFGETISSLVPDSLGFLFKVFTTRQQRVERVVILPSNEKGELTIMQGEKINFTAVGLQKGQPASGLQFTWSITDTLRKRPAKRLNNGIFEAKIPGTFIIVAETQGVQSQINVTVLPNEGIGLQKLLQKNEAETNDREKQGLNKLKAENKLIERKISTKNDYQREEEERRSELFKQKQNEVKVKQNEVKVKRPNPFQVSENKETNESKLEGVDRAEAEGMVDEDRLRAALEEVEKEQLEKKNAKNSEKLVTSETQNSKNVNTSETTQPVPFNPLLEDGWNDNNWWETDNPKNRVGNPPGAAPDAEAGSGNFQFSAPVVALPGRGMDINLSLSYNSRVWSKADNTMSFDADKGNPAPGWNLGFGKMMYMGPNGGCMLVDADGTRKAYSGSNSTYSSGSYFSNNFTGHTADNSFTDYTCYYSSSSYGTYLSGSAKLANGTTVYYGSQSLGNDQVYPTQITDANGNFITITYQNNRGPIITTVTDTMGRVISFNYDSLNRLISVTVPGFNNGPARTAVQLHYSQLPLSYSFGGLTVNVPNNTPWVIDAIYYPGTNTGYWFGDNDSYSGYGMIQKVVEKRGMSSTGTTNDQGTVTPGNLDTKSAVYSFQTAGTLNDAPTYNSLTESWAGMDTPPAVTQYNVNNNDSKIDIFGNTVTCYTTKVTQPNGLISKQYAYKTGGWTDGLIFADETIKIVNGQEVLIASSQVRWVLGVYDSPIPTETKETNHEINKTKRTTMDYGPNHNQVISKKEYDYDNNLVRETRTDYVLSPGYSNPYWNNRHIFSLVKSQEVLDGAGVRLAKTEYEYDNNAAVIGTNSPNLAPAAGVIMHNFTSDPFTTVTQDGVCLNGQWNHSECEGYSDGISIWVGEDPQYEIICSYTCYEYEQVSAYDPNTIFRGNVTKITSYADAQNATPTQAVVSTKQYDITGNLVAESAACCEQKTYTYNISNQFAYPVSFSRGTADNTLRVTSSSTYDFWTGLVLTSTDPNGRTDSTIYNVNNLRPIQVNSSTGAYSQTFYDDAAMTITSETHEYGGSLASKSVEYLNGIGKVKREEALGEGNVWDRVDTKYTNLGEIWKESNPYRVGETIYETETVYDLSGRTIQIIGPDGSTTQILYNELQRPDSASNLPGETVRQIDAWGRERWSRTNALGQMVEVVEPNPDGNGSVFYPGSWVTNYQYDVTNNLTKTIQGALPNQQIREFRYDTLGRMTRQKLAEKSATINDAGVFVGEGGAGAKWSSAVLAYDSRSNILQSMDARGVKFTFSYQTALGEDPLNRLQSISYDSTLNPNIVQVPTVNFYYENDPAKDRNQLKMISNGNVSDENIFDAEGRVVTTTRKLINKGNFTMTTNYTYDSLNRVISIQNPEQTGLPGNPTKLVTNTYDITNSVSSITFNGQQQAGGIVYNASGQITSINIGVSGANQVNEQYQFDAPTGLLLNQKAIRNGTELINLTYDYTRNGSIGNTNPNWKTGAITKIINNLNNNPASQNKNREYQYDALGRLRFAKGGPTSNLWMQEYQYDRFGNRTAVNLAPGSQAADGSPMVRDGIASLTYNQTNNRITTAGFQYDEAGNQTRAIAENGTDWHLFEYDAANRLIKISKDNGQGNQPTLLQAQEFGVGNDRLSQLDNVTNQRTYYYGSIEYSESNNNGNLLWSKSYVYFNDSILSTITPNGQNGETVEYNHSDMLGTKVVTNQQTGTSIEQNTLPFGTALGAESSGQTAKRFTSYERSSRTGLDYAQNRTYDSKQGRFTQVDPIEIEASELESPQTLNLYTYCGNDPINHTDPDGLFFKAIGRFFKKVFTSKWFLLAVSVALIVIGVGAKLGIWALTKVVTKTAVISGIFGPVTISYQATVYSVLGLINAGLTVAAAIPTLTSLSGLVKNAFSFGFGNILGNFTGASRNSGTPGWNPDSNNFKPGPGRRGRRSGRRTNGPGSWAWGTGRNPRRPTRPPVRFRGLDQNRPWNELSNPQIEQAFAGLGVTPTHHFLFRLRDNRTAHKVRNLSDFANYWNNGLKNGIITSRDGTWILRHNGVDIVTNPIQRTIITIKPAGSKY